MDPERILIVRLSHLGDAVCTLGLLHALHAAYPRARIAWAIQPEFAGLLEGLPGLERVLTFDRGGGLAAWPRLRSALRAFRPQWTVDAQGNLKSALVTLLSGAQRRSGMAAADWRERLGARVLNDPAPALARAPGERAHLLARMEVLARHVAPAGVARLLDGALPSDAERAAGHARWRELLGDAPDPVLLSLSSPEDIRAWPLAAWERLASDLASAGRGVVVLSGPREAAAGRALERALGPRPRVAHWTGQRGLRALVGFLAAGAERGVPLVGCDSGPMHLAWSVGQRVVLLAGPQDPRWTGPWPPDAGGHRVVRATREPACAPCLRRTCDHPRGPVCMADLAPEAVIAALASGVSGRAGGP